MLVYCDYLADLHPEKWDDNCRRDMIISTFISILAGDYHRDGAKAVEAVQQVLMLARRYCDDIDTLTSSINHVWHRLETHGLDALKEGGIKLDIHLILLCVANTEKPVK
nr:MAG TPA: hypothetical protein [Caudoviricetes sp.]